MTSDITTTHPDPNQLRHALTDFIRDRGFLTTTQVEAAFRAVPRHLFLPGIDLETAYAPQVVVTKRADDGTALSSASSPKLVAAMLEQLDVQPGQRILEIGTATGINAALLAELTGPSGTIVTIEIDDDLSATARRALDEAGYPNVQAICGDGALGYQPQAPYHRIIVTADAHDIPTAWWYQLHDGGRLVVPLSLHGSGLTRSLAFDRHGDHMTSQSALVCGFVPMRGAAQKTGHSLRLADGVTLNLDPREMVDDTALRRVLAHPAREHWTGIVVHDHEPVQHLDLWLVTIGSRFARLSVKRAARDAGVANPARRWAGATLYNDDSIAYLTLRPRTPTSDEIGIVGHGPISPALVADTAELLHTWDRDRPGHPTITAQPATTPDQQRPAGYHIDRPNTRLTIVW